MSNYIGRFRIDGVLGKGAMGVIYKAFDPVIERTVVLKTIGKDGRHDNVRMRSLTRLRNEARACGRLTHPNIVTVYDYGDIEESAFVAMEYVQGKPLTAYLVASRPNDLPQVVSWMTQLLSALAHAHARGVVHRDIKPANIIITPEAMVKLIDFGIALIKSETLPQPYSIVGTPSYMSPEQVQGGAIDGRSDVFSAAVVLYELLTGRRPFTGTASVVIQQILHEQPAAVSSINKSLSCELNNVLQLALAKNPAHRYATANAFLSGLGAVHIDV